MARSGGGALEIDVQSHRCAALTRAIASASDLRLGLHGVQASMRTYVSLQPEFFMLQLVTETSLELHLIPS